MNTIFQKKVSCPYKEQLIQDMLEHARTHSYGSPNNVYGDMQISNEQLKQFWTDFLRENRLGSKIVSIWVHFMKPTADHKDGHLHEGNTGVYYLKASRDSGTLVFLDDNILVEPEEGMFVVVPAKTNHAILENKSNEIRIALAFNFE